MNEFSNITSFMNVLRNKILIWLNALVILFIDSVMLINELVIWLIPKYFKRNNAN